MAILSRIGSSLFTSTRKAVFPARGRGVPIITSDFALSLGARAFTPRAFSSPDLQETKSQRDHYAHEKFFLSAHTRIHSEGTLPLLIQPIFPLDQRKRESLNWDAPG